MTGATVVRFSGLIFLLGSISAAKHPNIVGGTNAVIKHVPFLVSLRDMTGDHFCGGSIISNKHILTAAHCMYDIDEDILKNLTVHSGTSRVDRVGDVHKILSVRRHSGFDITNDKDGYPHDVAVITLEKPIVFNKYQQKIDLPTHDVQNYEMGYVAGWGRVNASTGEHPKQIQKLRVALLPYEKCKPLLRHKMNPEQVCAFRGSTKGACHGDSGGPLVSHGKIVGIVSYGDTGICANSVPDVYTNVFAYKDFIESAMKE